MAYTLKNFRYQEWLCKTNFSFLVGASHPNELLLSAAELGYDALCINDFGGQYGLARTFNDLRHLKKKQDISLKLNYGCELHLAPDHQKPLLEQRSLTFVAQDWQGYQNLNRLISFAQLKGKAQAWVSPKEILDFDLSQLFAIVPMRHVDFSDATYQHFKNLKEALNGALYFALTKSYSALSDTYIPKTQNRAQRLECKTLFSQDIFYHHRHLKSFHDLLSAIRTNKTVDQAMSEFLPNGERSLHQRSFLWKTYQRFPKFQQTLSLMDALNESCTFSLDQIHYKYPKEMIPENHTSQSYLEHLVWERISSHYKNHIPPKMATLVSKELDIIEDLNFADYFLTVWDIVDWARQQNILCQGRGSAANSAVCYFLGITACDPEHFDLLFERFVSKERGDPPDIDVDFEHERREEVIQYIYRRYGRKRAAMVANVITFRGKGALRAVGKALGVSDTALGQISKLKSRVNLRGKPLSEVLQEYQQKNKLADLGVQDVPENFPWHLWSHFSHKLQGFPRHLGLHSGGFIISQHPMDQLVPQEPATMTGRTVIQWCKGDIEELGFFKIDCLALGMLTALRKCLDLMSTHYGRSMSMTTIPKEDPATYTMIQNADTVGVFQIESRAQMSMLPRLKPQCFYDLVIEIAIIRPGPIQGNVIHPYLRRRHGKDPVTYPDPRVKQALSKTLGVVIFQEQAMRIAMALGDFTPGEANELRKHIGTWNSKDFSRNLNPYLKKLFHGLKKQNIDPKFTKQLIEQMKGFAHYGFPESHAISFAFLAYASSYLKCHYPAAFFTALLNSQPMGFYSPHALLQAAQRQAVTVLPISILKSQWDHTLEALPQKEGRPPVFAIRLGLRIVKGLSRQAAAILTAESSRPSWKTLSDCTSKVSLARDDYTALAAANAFADFGLQRFEALWTSEAIPVKPMIDTEDTNGKHQINWKEQSEFQKAQMDFVAFGTSLEDHPAKMVKDHCWPYAPELQEIQNSDQLSAGKAGRIVRTFGMVLSKQAPPSAKGMVFLTLEDEFGFINLAFPPDIYSKFCDLVEGSGLLCVEGKLQKVENYHSLLVRHVFKEDRSKILQLSKKDKRTALSSQNQFHRNPRSYY